MKRAGLKRIDDAITEAIRDAQASLEDHAKDPREIRGFLAGVIDGLKQAKFIVANSGDKRK